MGERHLEEGLRERRKRHTDSSLSSLSLSILLSILLSLALSLPPSLSTRRGCVLPAQVVKSSELDAGVDGAAHDDLDGHDGPNATNGFVKRIEHRCQNGHVVSARHHCASKPVGSAAAFVSKTDRIKKRAEELRRKMGDRLYTTQ
jgi:hypothetical protein